MSALRDDSSRPLRDQVYTVSELTELIKENLERSFTDIALEGEISGLKRHYSGHTYFSLKDERALIAAVIWRSSAARMRYEPEDGEMVRVIGRISLYPPQGRYQFVVSSIEPKGFGALQAAYEKLKKRLYDEGLFDAGLKRALPKFPSAVGLVSSLSGAAIRDMIRTIRRRAPHIKIYVAPAKVQGAGAAETIVEAIGALNRSGLVDLIIIGRGGGSIEDLWAFNEEILAREIHRSELPIVSAVGHETDHTIADFVADERASTPTAAAELISPRRDDLIARIDELTYLCRRRLRSKVETLFQLVDERDQRGIKSIRQIITRSGAGLDAQLKLMRARSPQAKLARDKIRLKTLDKEITRAIKARLKADSARHEILIARLAAFKIDKLLARSSEALEILSRRLERSARRALESSRARAEIMAARFDSFSIEKYLLALQTHFASLDRRLLRSAWGIFARERGRARALKAKLNAYSPTAVLRRGYAIARRMEPLEASRPNAWSRIKSLFVGRPMSPAAQPLKSARSVDLGDKVDLRLAEGSIEVRVEKIKNLDM